VAPRADDDLFRLPVDRSFSVKGTGTVVTGTVWSGRLDRRPVGAHTADERVGASARIQNAWHARRRRRCLARGPPSPSSASSRRMCRAGSVLVSDPRGARRRSPAPTSACFRASRRHCGRARRVRFHVGTSEVGARVVARVVTEGAPFAAGLSFDEPVVLAAGDRFVLARRRR
jgi:selenocysteine-specific elongation factor